MALTVPSMSSKIQAHLTAQGFNLAGKGRDNLAWLEKLTLAISAGVIEEIVANSELVAIARDSGEAGAGIIAGKVM